MSTDIITGEVLDAPADEPLGATLELHANLYLNARRKVGQGTLDAAAEVAAAHLVARHGQWGPWLRKVGLSAASADRLLAIHRTAKEDAQFAEGVRSGFLTASIAGELAWAPAALRESFLGRAEPPTAAEVRAEKRALANPPTLGEMATPAAPAPDLSALFGSLTIKLLAERGWQPTGETRLVEEGGRPTRVFELLAPPNPGSGIRHAVWKSREGIEGITRATLSAFPPGPVAGVIGSVETRLREGRPESGDAALLADAGGKLEAAREGMRPDVYDAWRGRIDAARAALPVAEEAPADDLAEKLARVRAVAVAQTVTREAETAPEPGEELDAQMVDAIDAVLRTLPEPAVRVLAARLCFDDTADVAFDAPLDRLYAGFADVAKQGTISIAPLAYRQAAQRTLAELRRAMEPAPAETRSAA